MEPTIRTLIAKIQSVADSEGNPCSPAEADRIASDLIRLFVTRHPLLEEYAQDKLDALRFSADAE
jgi:hypothetical protein